MRMMVIGYVMGVSSKRCFCDEVDPNLACILFCRLEPKGKVQDHSTFYRIRHGKFRESNLLRQVFVATVERSIPCPVMAFLSTPA
ncbi:transposase [Tropicimonas aquimaris]|uniref:Transposase n=1 Tax=Tropicimonas aquimaris TaxID=914152 RepID=A0ABW3IPX1_9RHOB